MNPLVLALASAEPPPEIEGLFTWLFDQIGMVVVLAVVGWAFATGRIVAGKQYRDLEEANRKLLEANDKHASANVENASGVKLTVSMMENFIRSLDKKG